MRNGGLIMFVDLDLASRVRFHTGGWEVKPVAIRLAANGIDERVALSFFPALKFCKNAISLWIDSHSRHFFAKAESSAHLAKMISQGLHDLAIYEIQNRGALVYQGDFGSQRREKRGVFKSDNTRADHDDFPGQPFHAGKTVGIDDTFIIKW